MNNPVKHEYRDLPDFLQFLDQKLNYHVRLGHREELNFEIYNADFSAWKLRFSDRTPVIHVRRKDAEGFSTRDLGQSLTDVVRIQNLLERNPIILLDGKGEELRDYFKTRALSLVILDERDQEEIRTSRRPTGDLLDRVSAQLELFRLSPYETTKPVTGSRFFGRQYDIRRILHGGDTNFAIMGIRRIGKTSLMREIERQLKEQAIDRGDSQAEKRVLYMDCNAIRSTADFMQEIVRQFSPRELTRLYNQQFPIYFPNFLERMSKQYGGQLIFLLDEFDGLLDALAGDADLLKKLRAGSNAGHCRFIIAGYRRLLRSVHDQDSPLYNFVTPLRLKEFRRDEAVSLIVEPMENMRIRLEQRNEIIDTIYQETAGQPNLIQYYCSILLDGLERAEQRVITPQSLVNIYTDEDFRSFILNTFMDNTNEMEKALVYAIILEAGETGSSSYEGTFDLELMDSFLKSRGVEMFLSDLEVCCRNLELAGTFTKEGRSYRFTTPIFPRLLEENYNVSFLFRKLVEEGIW
ncbi:MAG: ATP-binding protein [Caldilineaceae bacterium]|nr:ATP-binding protein [Caldilineaceae bacterium]